MVQGILAGVGALKGLLDSEKERRQKQAQAGSDAAAIRFSPWSGLQTSNLVGKDYSSQDAVSSALAGGLSGFQTGANIENSLAENAYNEKLAKYLADKVPSSDEWSGFTPDKNAMLKYASAAVKPKSPYSEIYNAQLGYEPAGEDNIENLLKGQARRSFGNA